MIRRIAEYTVKPKSVEDVEKIVKEFVLQVKKNEPETIYKSYRRENGTSFIHFMEFPDQEAVERHQKADYTAKLVEGLYPNCTEPPKFTDLELI
ncbi:putative quinol monooxygenase [Aquibacillus albus]|uniref:Quinol monooxygenase YgiN n=1 Tax=Aquibacillus albus TaxID=1168171 RepID=A0ABS2N3N5_9BACI|nr:antibiotic biosynthesis monooxygenase [Aquibacillus albus]MBM7572719.1 quinol monooxygenase YgiN [Aquibacillus albus]